MKTVYKLTMPADCEGRSSHTVGYFTTRSLAENIGKTGFGNRSMGPNNGRVDEVRLYETPNDFYAANESANPSKYPGQVDAREIHRQRALAKLTPEERKALGV